mmetsp:Transcript_5885/g.7417  ORF Transcript_5885/g.7417 Transcript_5885/m.7417 type:complete len:231 (+) Transcript_5885:87-779(+)|eukprot:CAMPEP_0172508816 /NCGR_PEP_ID=MMETSP1066-20121228/215102_1 /TAXON_ID=671091 /ORGANISM="Coscinodiscus wailesii, Strain CCMP2513" /LENGTH=230 /DNA_ID=CAMNT_0013286991 /DNA_START=87 /DNA_END=779 /DNA_ORIENTATION=+
MFHQFEFSQKQQQQHVGSTATPEPSPVELLNPLKRKSRTISKSHETASRPDTNLCPLPLKRQRKKYTEIFPECEGTEFDCFSNTAHSHWSDESSGTLSTADELSRSYWDCMFNSQTHLRSRYPCLIDMSSTLVSASTDEDGSIDDQIPIGDIQGLMLSNQGTHDSGIVATKENYHDWDNDDEHVEFSSVFRRPSTAIKFNEKKGESNVHGWVYGDVRRATRVVAMETESS